MLTALQKQGSLIPVSAKNADEDSKPLLDNIGRTASVCDAIFVRDLPDFTGGWSRNKGFSPRISAPVSNVAGFEQPPASIVLKNDLGGFVQIFNIGGLYDEFNQISEQRAGSHQHQRHSIFKGSSNWGHLAISQRLPRCSENFSTAQKRIYSRHDAFNRTADERGQAVDERVFGARSGIDRDVRANARRVAIPRLYLGRFRRQAIYQSPSGTNQTAEIANKHFANGLSLRKRSFSKIWDYNQKGLSTKEIARLILKSPRRIRECLQALEFMGFPVQRRKPGKQKKQLSLPFGG